MELQSDLLDYVDADGRAENNTAHGGDPFRFAATTSLSAVGAAPGFGFTWAGINIINPDIDQDGTNDFTTAVLVEDMRHLALDVVRGNRSVFGTELLAGSMP